MPGLWLWVEGDGEVAAARELARRILHGRLGAYDWQVVSTAKMGGLGAFRKKMERMVGYLRRRPEVDAVLVLLDLDDGCAAEIAPQLAEDLRVLNPPKPIAIVFAVREYEAWFLAAARSLWKRDYAGDPEGRRDAKGEVRQHFFADYAPTLNQAGLSARMSLDEAAANSRSFRRLLHALDELRQAVAQERVGVTPQ